MTSGMWMKSGNAPPVGRSFDSTAPYGGKFFGDSVTTSFEPSTGYRPVSA